MRMALVNDQRWSSVIWIGAGFVAAILTFWDPVVIRQQWDSHRALVQSAWFSFLPALWSLGHFVYLLWLCRGGRRAIVPLAVVLLLGSLMPMALLARRLWF